MMATFRACPRKFFLEYCQHWRPASPNVHLHAGGAYASALEQSRKAYYEQGMEKDKAEAVGMEVLMKEYGDFECPPSIKKSLDRMMGALEFYYYEYPFDRDLAIPMKMANGKRAVEFTFAYPLPFKHPETGEPLIYCGRSDMIVEFAGGIYILDDKTTSQLGTSWSKQWTNRSQFSGYCYVAREMGIPVQGVIVRGLSILSSRYETQQVITPRTPFMLDLWYNQLLKDIQRMLDSYKENYYDYNLDHTCGEYGGCNFMNVCSSPTPEEWLQIYFQKKVWNPLARIEEVKNDNS